MAHRVDKVTISLPAELISVADEVAAERHISRSKVFSLCLKELARQRLQRKLADGYKSLAKDNLAFAVHAAETAQEILPEWE